MLPQGNIDIWLSENEQITESSAEKIKALNTNFDLLITCQCLL